MPKPNPQVDLARKVGELVLSVWRLEAYAQALEALVPPDPPEEPHADDLH